MSFTRLVLTGDDALRKIQTITLVRDNDTGTAKPEYITRLRYDVKREYRIDNVSVGTPQRRPDLPYNSFRLIHTWIGYADVITECVSVHEFSSDADKETVALIKTAAILEVTEGVEHTIVYFDPSELGPDQPNLGGQYTRAYDQGLEWVYDVSSDGGNPPVYTDDTTTYWVIKDISITDNGNNTSRVQFHFEFIEPWEALADYL